LTSLSSVSKYLNRLDIRLKLGVDPSITGNFSSAEWDVIEAFANNMDEWRPAQYHVAALLERGIRALVYVGKNDFICNHVGNKAWIDELEWSGHDDFASQPMREWLVDGKAVGVTKGARGLTFAILNGAGHMVR
jgi:carboxypeptidase C (cathepsin A)